MSLADILRGAIGTAKSVLDTGGLMATVYLREPAQTVLRNEDGTPIRSKRTPIKAVMSKSNRLMRTPGGTEFVAATKVLFLEPVEIGAEAAIELPDGTIPTYQALGEGVQPSSGGNLTTSVYCG